MQWHFSPETGCPFWLQWAEKAGWDPRKEVKQYEDLDKFGPFQDEWLRGGPVRRWVPRAYQGQADLHVRNRRQHRRAEVAHRHRRLPHRLRAVQQDAAGRQVSEGRRLADDRPERPAPAAARHRASRATSRRHLLHGRSRSALGDQADQDGRDGDDGAVQAPRHRPGAHAPEGARHHQVPVHHAEAARGVVRARVAEESRHHRRVLRRHRDDAAVPSLRGRGVDGRRATSRRPTATR